MLNQQNEKSSQKRKMDGTGTESPERRQSLKINMENHKRNMRKQIMSRIKEL